MSSLLPELRLSVRDRPCRARCSFDTAAAVFSAEFELAGPEPAPTLVQRLERQLGIRERSVRLVLGEVDITFVAPGRLVAIDLRDSSVLWRHERVQAPVEAPAIWFDPAVEFDANGLCVSDVETVTSWDPEARALTLRFMGGVPERWFELAENVYVGVDAEARLCKLMFVGVSEGHRPVVA